MEKKTHIRGSTLKHVGVAKPQTQQITYFLTHQFKEKKNVQRKIKTDFEQIKNIHSQSCSSNNTVHS